MTAAALAFIARCRAGGPGRNRSFEHGHPELRGGADEGAMFPTWFRLLSLTLIGQALPGPASWRFPDCRGMQFRDARRNEHANASH